MKHGTTCLLIVYGILIVCLYIRKFLTKEFTTLTKPSDESWNLLVKFIEEIYDGMTLNDAPGDVIPPELDCDVHIKGDLLVGTYGTYDDYWGGTGGFTENIGDDKMDQNKNNAMSKTNELGINMLPPLEDTGEIYSWYANNTELNTTKISGNGNPVYTCTRRKFLSPTTGTILSNPSFHYANTLDGLKCNRMKVSYIHPSSKLSDEPHWAYLRNVENDGKYGKKYGKKDGDMVSRGWDKGWIFPTHSNYDLIKDDPYTLIIEGNVHSTSTTQTFLCGTFHSEHKFFTHSEVRFHKVLGSMHNGSYKWRGWHDYDKGWLYFDQDSLKRRPGDGDYYFPRKWWTGD